MLCKQCGKRFKHEDAQTWWDENGVWSMKLAECPYCNRVNVIKSEIYFELDVNNDSRYYDYRRRI